MDKNYTKTQKQFLKSFCKKGYLIIDSDNRIPNINDKIRKIREKRPDIRIIKIPSTDRIHAVFTERKAEKLYYELLRKYPKEMKGPSKVRRIQIMLFRNLNEQATQQLLRNLLNKGRLKENSKWRDYKIYGV